YRPDSVLAEGLAGYFTITAFKVNTTCIGDGVDIKFGIVNFLDKKCLKLSFYKHLCISILSFSQ
ncbi:MAG TPA: hypothetical protein ACFYDZ_07270, partial [Candidatus Brocadiaceae bacterium]